MNEMDTPNWAIDLTGPALNIATSDGKRLRVLAGPGTGKSFAMKRRVARLLEQGQDPERILAVTFTRNAAADLVKDLHALGVKGCEKVHVSTLHSFCFSILNRNDVFEYVNRIPRPLVTISKAGSMQFEGGVLLDDLVLGNKFGGKRECTKRILAFEAAWARLQSDDPGWAQNETDQSFHDELIDWLRFHRAMLIGELVPETLRFLRNNPVSDVLTAFDHIIVDEYQDLNRAEQELIDILAGDGASAIVGDPNQSIYSFRHANPEGIEQFNARHPDTHDETLAECRRCPTWVIEMANSVIKNNPSDSKLLLSPTPQSVGGEVHIVQWESIEQEAQGIVAYVNWLASQRGYTPGNILLLTPRRRMGYRIRDLLKQRDVPAYSFYHEEALETYSAQRAFALLTLLCNREDRVALRWWLRQGSSSGRSKAYQVLRRHCEVSGDTPRGALEEIFKGTLQLPKAKSLLKQYQELEDAISKMSDLSLPELADKLFPEGEDDLNALREVALMGLSEAENVADLFDHVKTHITQPEVPDGDFVRIMSLHKSKGLTSKATIIAGCTQGLIPFESFEPDKLTPEEKLAQLQEQRRLFYVAITRCTDVLVVSSFATIDYNIAKQIGVSVQTRTGKGSVGKTIASQFIDELGASAPKSQKGSTWAVSKFLQSEYAKGSMVHPTLSG